MVLYDQGDTSTVEFKNIPPAPNSADPTGGVSQDDGETEGTTNKSGVDEDVMGLECDG